MQEGFYSERCRLTTYPTVRLDFQSLIAASARVMASVLTTFALFSPSPEALAKTGWMTPRFFANLSDWPWAFRPKIGVFPTILTSSVARINQHGKTFNHSAVFR